MKAVILAAGKGSRLGHLTYDTPKSMLKLNDNHTLLSYNIMQLSKAGINDIILVSGYQSQKIEDYSQELAKIYDISINNILNPFWDHCNVLGSFYMSLGIIKDDFIFLHADTVSSKEVVDGLITSASDVCLAVDLKPCGEEEMKVWLKNNKVERITKFNIGYEADGEFVGIAKFSRNMVEYFEERSRAIFKLGVLDSYMEQVLDNGIIEDNLVVKYFDASAYSTIEVDFIEDLTLAQSMFSD
jgi:L-glutamine-phosphate cytidylyltransferase